MIVITAPTSQIGSQLLGHLDLADLRVVARDPSRLPKPVRDQAEIVIGSHGDPQVIRTALAGADAVFWLVPPDPHADDIVDYYRQFTEPFCDAIAGHGVERVVYVTTLGQGYAHQAGHLSAALAMDEMIDRTGVAYRALRMPYFMENLAGQIDAVKEHGVFYLPNDVDSTLLTVATRDIAHTAASMLLDASWSDQRSVPVIGPDNLTPQQMAAVISNVIGRPVRAQHMPRQKFHTMMTAYGLSAGFVRGLIAMAAAQDNGIYDNDAADAPRAATSFAQWSRETFSSAVEA